MNELLIIIFRTILLYVIILIILRLMGKREVGELSVFDVVVFMIMAEIAALALDSTEKSLFHTISPMLVLLLIQRLVSHISLRSKKFRNIVDGEPSVIIRDGHIEEAEMRKQRYNLDDLFQQLREQQVGSVQEVKFAFLEPSGNLSVFTEDETPPVLSLISDGIVQEKHLMMIDKTVAWLEKELKKHNQTDTSAIFYCSYEDGKLYYQLKEQQEGN